MESLPAPFQPAATIMAHRKQWTDTDKAHWQAQTEERTAALLEQLEAGVQAIQTSDDFKSYLRTAATFHNYRPNNVLLILAQKVDATRTPGRLHSHRLAEPGVARTHPAGQQITRPGERAWE